MQFRIFVAKKKLKNAMLVIEVFDISRKLDEEDLELLEYVKKLGKKVIIVLNKSDLENVVERSQLEKYSDYVIDDADYVVTPDNEWYILDLENKQIDKELKVKVDKNGVWL